MRRCRRRWSAPLLVLALLAGCGEDDPAEGATADGEGVTIESCGRETTYEAAPERAVPMDQNVTELMLALGLEDSIAGYARQHFDPTRPVLPEYQEAYDGLDLIAEESPSREAFLSVEPDFALAAFGFSDDSGLSEEGLREDGIDTYLLPDQCDGRDEPVTFDDLDRAITDIGAIFRVDDRAEALMAEVEATLAEVADRVDGAEPVRVLIYDSGEDAPFTVGGRGMSNAIVEAAGGINVFADQPDQFFDATWEDSLAAAPEVVVVMNYFHGDDGSATDAKRAVIEDRLAGTPAVEEGRVVALDLTGFFLGPRNADTVAELADILHP